MAIWTRNCQPLNPTAPTTGANSVRAWFYREMMLAGRWTENSNNGDAAWASALNVLLSVAAGPNGLSVDSGKPREVHSPSGAFLAAHVGATLNLSATNDQNRGLWRISELLSPYDVKVDLAGWFPQGWVDESNMAARITKGDGLTLTTGAWVLMDAPAGSNTQVRIVYGGTNSLLVYVRPRGKLADLTEITSVDLSGYNATGIKINAYFDGGTFMILIPQVISSAFSVACLSVGALLDADAADTDPVFLLSSKDRMVLDPLHLISIRMLNSVLAQIEAYTTTVKTATTANITTAGVDLHNIFGRRLLTLDNLAPIRSPWVVLNDTATVGACVRGRLPLFRTTYRGFERFTPMDPNGDWQHVDNGIVIARSDPNEPLISWPE